MIGEGTDDRHRVKIWSLVDLARVADMLAKLPRSAAVGPELGELVWGGTELEYDSLVLAVDSNAECTWMVWGGRKRSGCGFRYEELPVCAAHQLLLRQDSLDHLLTVLRNRQFYVTRERVLAGV